MFEVFLGFLCIQVTNVSEPNDEGITALHNAICAGHYEIVTFLVEFGCDVNSPDSDGWLVQYIYYELQFLYPFDLRNYCLRCCYLLLSV